MPINEEQTAHRQHAVPQNIMSVEFKLVGDLTVRQFVYLVIGGLTVYLSFISKLSFLWKWGLIVFGGFGSLALAFVPFGDRGLDQWIKNFIKSISMPTQRVWKKTLNAPEYFLADYADVLKKEVVALAPTKSRRALTDYMENPFRPSKSTLDEKEESFLKRINFDVELPSHLKSVATVLAPPKTEIAETKREVSPKSFEFQKQFSAAPVKLSPSGVAKNEEEADFRNRPVVTVTNVAVGRILRHIPLEGEIILPKRTRRVLVMSEKPIASVEDKHTQELLKQAEELRRVLKKAEANFTPEGAVLPAHELILENKQVLGGKEKELQGIISTLRVENKKLSEEMGSLRTQMQGLDKTKETYKRQLLEFEQKIKTLEQKKNLVEETMRNKVSGPSENVPVPSSSPEVSDGGRENIEILKKLSATVARGAKQGEEKQGEQTAGSLPNVIWGTVRDKEGFLLDNATLIIRDENDDPVRALKTNKLGQFMSSTSLPNGIYKIEVLNSENTFDIIKVSLVGKALKSLDFSAVLK